ncbi:hypothetical protein CC78DRAFT_581304 [Lojkania enalia]|uniref:Uncharacterized protein n=1 Tax=Lojkania enalia TaxID=147567 RepID=A0A9P4K676_9PLEO|nr:hypothetical protein CC78DRAFT_581304 [Didymosphaeria enalia]
MAYPDRSRNSWRVTTQLSVTTHPTCTLRYHLSNRPMPLAPGYFRCGSAVFPTRRAADSDSKALGKELRLQCHLSLSNSTFEIIITKFPFVPLSMLLIYTAESWKLRESLPLSFQLANVKFKISLKLLTFTETVRGAEKILRQTSADISMTCGILWVLCILAALQAAPSLALQELADGIDSIEESVEC